MSYRHDGYAATAAAAPTCVRAACKTSAALARNPSAAMRTPALACNTYESADTDVHLLDLFIRYFWQ